MVIIPRFVSHAINRGGNSAAYNNSTTYDTKDSSSRQQQLYRRYSLPLRRPSSSNLLLKRQPHALGGHDMLSELWLIRSFVVQTSAYMLRP